MDTWLLNTYSLTEISKYIEVHVHQHACIYSFCPRSRDSAVTVRMPHIQILVKFSTENKNKNRLLRRMTDSWAGAGKAQYEREYPVLPESKEALKE